MGGTLTTRIKILTENIRSLGFQDIREGVEEVDVTKFRARSL